MYFQYPVRKKLLYPTGKFATYFVRTIGCLPPLVHIFYALVSCSAIPCSSVSGPGDILQYATLGGISYSTKPGGKHEDPARRRRIDGDPFGEREGGGGAPTTTLHGC